MLPTEIQLTLRIPKGSELTASELDTNFTNLRTALLGLAQTVGASRLVIGAEPPPGERVGVLWVPTGAKDGIYWWNNATSKWVLVKWPSLSGTTGGTNSDFTLSVAWPVNEYTDIKGSVIVARADRASQGASTFNLNAKGALPMKKYAASGVSDLAANDMVAWGIYAIVFDDDKFVLLNPTPAAAPIGVGGIYAVFEERQASGTNGGDFLSGAWRKRAINTEVYDPDAIGSIQPNAVRLNPGRYRYHGMAVSFRCGSTRLRLYNLTAGTPVNGGSSLSTFNENGDDNATVVDHVNGEFTIATQADMQLEHQCSTSYAGSGFGIKSDIAGEPEIYARLEFWKVA